MGGMRHNTMDDYEETSTEEPAARQQHDKGELAREYAEKHQKELGGLAALGVASRGGTDMSSAAYGGDAVGLSWAELDGLPHHLRAEAARIAAEYEARAAASLAVQAKLSEDHTKLENCRARDAAPRPCAFRHPSAG